MDVVKTHIEKIGGTIDLQSQVGRGTTIRIKIPLTLAIIPALIVSVGNEKFAIPQVNLLELVRVEESVSQTTIEWIGGSPVYRLRGKLLPLIYLNKFLAAEAGEEPSADKADGALNIVVLQADDHMFGLVVEEVHDTQEIVVKPLSELLKGTNCYAGATIMGDGNVALILDVVGLVQLGGIVNETRESGDRRQRAADRHRCRTTKSAAVSQRNKPFGGSSGAGRKAGGIPALRDRTCRRS